MMNIEFKFENPEHDWAVLHVFKKYYEYFLETNHDIKTTYINSGLFFERFGGGQNSAHILKIKNSLNDKFILISYWDRVKDFFIKNNGWQDIDNCVEIITSSGTDSNYKTTPFCYLPYLTKFDEWSKKSKKISEKLECNLFFRGFLYGNRLDLKETKKINIIERKIDPKSYFDELTNNKICLSLNGAGEICNRDIEILSAQSVLLRPKLKTRFYNELIDGHHYVSFELNDDPKTQSEIIIKKFNEIKKNDELLKQISENGHLWFIQNGTVDSNFNILKKLINIDKLL